ncbi:MAG: hypothetical protein ACO2ZM_09275 [Francisellaceae bacterium]
MSLAPVASIIKPQIYSWYELYCKRQVSVVPLDKNKLPKMLGTLRSFLEGELIPLLLQLSPDQYFFLGSVVSKRRHVDLELAFPLSKNAFFKADLENVEVGYEHSIDDHVLYFMLLQALIKEPGQYMDSFCCEEPLKRFYGYDLNDKLYAFDDYLLELWNKKSYRGIFRQITEIWQSVDERLPHRHFLEQIIVSHAMQVSEKGLRWLK